MATQDDAPRIVIIKNGPYKILGHVPLVHKTQVVSEQGEPLSWKKEKEYDTGPDDCYYLCRCGKSKVMPFCDRFHREIGFDGTETADTGPIAKRQVRMKGGTHLIVMKDSSLCMDSGYCGLVGRTLEKFVEGSSDSEKRIIAISMVEKCPSGALTYRVEEDEPEIEPDLPRQIAATTEITSDGPIVGPLWVSGNIPVERSDQQPVETRNRVTLCNCGCSENKPFCDGTHRYMAEEM
jgi:CDGSH-type Zn-finger protein